MQALRSQVAILLLLCFTRVLVPDAWILALHAHQHTAEEVTESSVPGKTKAVVSAKHQHCAVDHFYDVPFQASLPLEFALSISYAAPVAASGASVWLATAPTTANLRGPPALGQLFV
ncbi:hypothetical protein [Hymenobacter elongatus]|uniref:Uncharacterized protein n=1 Tax=Hymenobacter elongatus TaxID=877208 RepID=A0A4Z0PRI8_9BACT|nr:hypothetical protein [Hymenobacter elongatus]TGE19641.1 hypothetical protein E5J99_02465 [Hymenobacter elongatus]